MTVRSVEAIKNDAAEWVARADAADWTDTEEVALEAWFCLDPRHRGAFLQAHAAWLSLDGQTCTAIAAEGLNANKADSWIVRRRLLASGGGVLVASLFGGMVWFNSGTTYQTQLGEIRRVPLSDGSTATINTQSQVVVRLAERHREVRLARGEAWFRVAKDARRPFVVEAGAVVVRAIGTAFSVRRKESGADILVTEGVVEAWSQLADGYRMTLVAGQRAFIGDDATVRLAPESPSAVDRALAWRSGTIDLSGETLIEAVADFNRYNDRQLVITDGRLGDQQVDGVFRTDDPEGFATAISRSFNVPVKLDDHAFIRIGNVASKNS